MDHVSRGFIRGYGYGGFGYEGRGGHVDGDGELHIAASAHVMWMEFVACMPYQNHAQ